MNTSTTKHVLVCQICNSIYEKPCILPCQKTVCKSHLCDSNGLQKESFECIFCKTSHKIPLKGFNLNYLIQEKIESEQYLTENELKLKFELDKSLKLNENSNEKLEQTEDIIRKYFSNIKIQINSHREYLKSQIDDQAEKLLDKASQIEAKFKLNINEKKLKLLDSQSSKLNLEAEFRKANIEIDKLEALKEKLNKHILELDESLNDLTENTMSSCYFEPNFKLRLEKSFGKLYHEFDLITCYTDGSIRIRDLENLNLKDFKVENVSSMQISLDNQRLIVGGKDHTIKVVCIKTAKLLKNISHANNDLNLKIIPLKNWKMDIIRCMSNTRNENEIICGYADSKIVVFDLDTDECKKMLIGHSGPITCLELFNNNLLVSGSSDFLLKIWNLKTGKNLKTLKAHTNEIRCVKKINELKFASGSSDSSIKIWSIWSSIEDDTQCIKTLYAQKGSVSCLKVNSFLNLLISASSLIEIWNLDDYTCVKKLTPNENSLPKCLEILPNNRIITGNSNKTLEIWDCSKGVSLKVLKDHTCDAKVFQIYPN
jgi:WD40 repeat protein